VRAAVATLGRLPRAAVALPRFFVLGPHGRRRLLALAVLAIALGAAYTFWFRDSSLVRVERVTVTGIDAPEAGRVRAKLTTAAKHMTTLHLDAAALRRSVADEPVVHSIVVHPDFPHGLKIGVVQNRATALLVSPGREVAVAPDGTLLESETSTAGLPEVHVAAIPARGRIPDGPARDRVQVAAAAPARLRSRVESISIEHGRGAVAQLRDGPVVIFGRPVELRLKWAAAAAVIAERSSAGAEYIDVRMPERPVAGGLPPEEDPQPQAQDAAAATPPVTAVTPAQPQPTQVTPASSSPVTAATAPVTPAATPSTEAQP
jgi:cell division protein FtsQ